MTAASPRKIVLLTTGGTIAMTAKDGGGGTVTQGAADLTASLGGALDGVELTSRNVLAKSSSSFTLGDIGVIATAVAGALREADGVVITQGTDTLEEVAFALALLVRTDTPVVLTAAMRRPDQPGADGPANLAAAIQVAASDKARGLGVLAVMDTEIHAAAFVRKAHSFRIHAFSSDPFGPIGWVAEDRVRIAMTPRVILPTLSYSSGQPVVPIVESGNDLSPKVIEALAPVVDGLVVALAGAGHVARDAVAPLVALAAQKPVVFASRTNAGETLRASYGFGGGEMELLQKGLIGAGMLTAAKARILVQLMLASGAGIADVRAVFDAI